MASPASATASVFTTRRPLTREQERVVHGRANERAFTGRYVQDTRPGRYACVCCGRELFDAADKFPSGSGWASFSDTVSSESVGFATDWSNGMFRTAVVCGDCGAHLGHVFPDGPAPTGNRFCINSCAIEHERDAATEPALQPRSPRV